MKKFSLVIVLFLFLGETCLTDSLNFADLETLSANLTVLPKSPPVIFSPAQANTIGPGKALRLTSAPGENPPILKYAVSQKLLNKIGTADTFSFFIKTESASKVEIAFEDNQKLTPFESINAYLPDRSVKKYWQKASIPFCANGIVTQKLKNIYFKIISPPSALKSIVYLDGFSMGTSANSSSRQEEYAYMLYDFDSVIQNKFSAEPYLKFLPPAEVTLTLTEKGHYGATGKSLLLKFNNPSPVPGNIFLPVLKNSYPFRTEHNTLIWQMKTENVFQYTAVLCYRNDDQAAKKNEPYYGREYKLVLPDTFWHQFSLPLDPKQKNEFVGLQIIIPANTSGCLYLDKLILK
jgi:hypothetical protein